MNTPLPNSTPPTECFTGYLNGIRVRTVVDLRSTVSSLNANSPVIIENFPLSYGAHVIDIPEMTHAFRPQRIGFIRSPYPVEFDVCLGRDWYASASKEHQGEWASIQSTLAMQYIDRFIRSINSKTMSHSDFDTVSRESACHGIESNRTHPEAHQKALTLHILKGDCGLSYNMPGCQHVCIESGSARPRDITAHLIATILLTTKKQLPTKTLKQLCEALNIIPDSSSYMSYRKSLASYSETLDRTGGIATLDFDAIERMDRKDAEGLGRAHGLVHQNFPCEQLKSAIKHHILDGHCVRATRGLDQDPGQTPRPGCLELQSVASAICIKNGYLPESYVLLPPDIRRSLQVSALIMNEHSIDRDTFHRLVAACGIEITDSSDLSRNAKRIKQALNPYRQSDSHDRPGSQAGLSIQERASDQPWPRVLTREAKDHLIQLFRDSTGTTALQTFECATCAESRLIRTELKPLRLTEFDWRLLLKDSDSQNTRLPDDWISTLAIQRTGLYRQGSDFGLKVCINCHAELTTRKRTPALSLANGLGVGTVPKELQNLTIVEEMMIARCRTRCMILQLKQSKDSRGDFENPNVSEGAARPSNPFAQKALRGHVIVFPQDPQGVARALPPTIQDITTYICIVFVGSNPPSDQWIRKKADPLYVRREKVRAALEWLKLNNPLYYEVELLEQRISDLPENGVLPFYIHHQTDDITHEFPTASYDPLRIGRALEREDRGTEHDVPYESVVITDVEQDASTNILKAAALRHLKLTGKQFVDVSHGPHPVNEFSNPKLFPMMFPTLFPFGTGGFEDSSRKTPVAFERHVKHLLRLADRRFQLHHTFLFSAFNMIQRRQALRHTKFKVSLPQFERVANTIASASVPAIISVTDRVATGDTSTAYSQEELTVLKLMKEVKMITSGVYGSAHSRAKMRNELKGLMMSIGMPSFFLTINPADIHNPVVRFLAGEDIDLDRLLPEEASRSQSFLVARNPVATAEFFNVFMKAFLRDILGFESTDQHISNSGGLLGKTKAFYGCVEAQGRGTLHCHILVWIYGAPNPNEIRDKIIKDPNGQFVTDLTEMLDDVISNYVPTPADPGCTSDPPPVHPCKTRGIDLASPNAAHDRQNDMYYLVKQCQSHSHGPSCWKYWKGGLAPKECRYDLDPSNVRPKTTVDAETGEITLRCLDGLINNYNETIMEAMRCNMDIKFIGSGKSAKAVLYYITDYISKSQLKAHVAYSALELAVQKLDAMLEIDDNLTRAKRLLQKCAYAIVSHQELSSQQIASYLLQHEDHFTSHKFRAIWWTSFETVLDKMSPPADRIDIKATGDEQSPPTTQSPIPSSETIPPDYHVLDDHEVVIDTEEGDLSARTGSVADYLLRPRKFEALSVWDFISQTRKIRARQGISAESSFLEPHVEASSHRLTRRKPTMYVIPVPCGTGIPRRDKPDGYNRYCRLMLLLFKPWRRLDDLKRPGESWKAAFELFVQKCYPIYTDIMNNMQLLHECRDSRDDHFADRRNRRRLVNEAVSTSWLQDADKEPDEGFNDETQEDILSHLQAIDESRSLVRGRGRAAAEACVACAEAIGLFASGPNQSSMTVDESSSHQNITMGNRSFETDWRLTYENAKEERRKRMRQPPSEDPSVDTINIPIPHYMIRSRPAVAQEEGSLPNSLVDDIESEFSLNREQALAFKIIAKAAEHNTKEPLRMYIGGSGGTGKSRILLATQEFFARRDETRRLRFTSYTGVAAHNIGGMTLHQALNLNQRSAKSGRSRTRQELISMWDGVDFLFVDEVSMIGCQLMLNIHQALTEAKSDPNPFGKINIIFAGDFAQLPPVGQVRLFAKLNTKISARSGTVKGQQNVLGKLLWLQVKTVTLLHRPMRQVGPGNTSFVQLLERLRTGKCDERDYDLLRSRIGCLPQRSEGSSWYQTPIIVGDNASKDLLNERAANQYAKETGHQIEWYHATDYHNGKPIDDDQLIAELNAYHSGQTGYRLTRLPLVEGMPVILSQNYDVENGVVNGTFGTLKYVRYQQLDNGRRRARSCVIECPSYRGKQFPHLKVGEIPVMEDTVDMRFTHPHSGKRCTIKRHQLPIFPAFSVTVYKAQGLTFPSAVMDLESCHSIEGSYVMLSRVKSLDGVTILRDFSRSKITSRQSEDSRREFARLRALNLKTVADYSDDALERHNAEVELQNVAVRIPSFHSKDESRDVAVTLYRLT